MSKKLAWSAGVVDGEGCIAIIRVPPTKKNKCRNVQFKSVLKVTMGHRPTVALLRRIVGCGTVQDHQPRSTKVNASYSWLCQSKQVETALVLLLPFLVTKREEALVMMKFLRLPKPPQGGRGGSQPMPRWLELKREKLYWKLRQLKPRWRFYREKEGRCRRSAISPTSSRPRT